MWKFLLLFMSLYVVTAEGESCTTRISKCERDGKTPEKLPENAEELQEACNSTSKYFECATPIVDGCDEEDFAFDYFYDVVSVFQRICDSDSLLHRALIEILPCLKRNAQLMHYCNADYDEEIFEAALSSNGITDVADTVEDGQNECLIFLYTHGCLLFKLDEVCGTLAKQFLLETLLSMDSMFSKCHRGTKVKIRDIAKVVQSLKKDVNDEDENGISQE